MGGNQAKHEEEELVWPVAGRKPYFFNGDYWAEQQGKFEPYRVLGKEGPLSLREAQNRVSDLGMVAVPPSFIHTYTANALWLNRGTGSKPEIQCF